MTTIPSDPFESVIPSETDALLAGKSARQLALKLARANGTMQLRVVEPDGQSETVAIPTRAFSLLVTILTEMASGNAVRLIPYQAELTTQEAADLLNTSRPYLVRLLNEGHIAFHTVGTHRRVRFKDVMEYKAEHRRARKGVLGRLSTLDQELGVK